MNETPHGADEGRGPSPAGSPPTGPPPTGALLPVSLGAAIRLLTIFPVPYHPLEDEQERSGALVWFPLVGLGVGALVALTFLLPLPPVAGAALALAVWTVVTGGLHEDGFLDCADAALAPVLLERRRAILKDPHVGAHGATFGALLLLMRLGALASVSALAVLAAPVIGRWCMTLGASLGLPTAPGLGASFTPRAADDATPDPAAAKDGGAGAPTVVALALLASLAAGGAVAGGGWVALVGVLMSALVGVATGLAATTWLARRLGGVSGDVFGAAGLIAETAALWVFVFLS